MIETLVIKDYVTNEILNIKPYPYGSFLKLAYDSCEFCICLKWATK
jgi:hypothetical protein